MKKRGEKTGGNAPKKRARGFSPVFDLEAPIHPDIEKKLRRIRTEQVVRSALNNERILKTNALFYVEKALDYFEKEGYPTSWGIDMAIPVLRELRDYLKRDRYAGTECNGNCEECTALPYCWLKFKERMRSEKKVET